MDKSYNMKIDLPPLSLIAFLIENEGSKISKEGMPTSAYVASSSEIEVFSGRSAIDKYGSRNANKLVHAIKTRMVEGTINVGGIFVNTDDIYAAIVRDLVILGNEARQSMGKEKIYDLVFTFPASIANDITMINRMQNSIEKNIVDGHKLHVVSRLPEPAAVAVDYLYYMRNIVEINKRIVKDEYSILVYDLGHHKKTWLERFLCLLRPEKNCQ